MPGVFVRLSAVLTRATFFDDIKREFLHDGQYYLPTWSLCPRFPTLLPQEQRLDTTGNVVIPLWNWLPFNMTHPGLLCHRYDGN